MATRTRKKSDAGKIQVIADGSVDHGARMGSAAPDRQRKTKVANRKARNLQRSGQVANPGWVAVLRSCGRGVSAIRHVCGCTVASVRKEFGAIVALGIMTGVLLAMMHFMGIAFNG